MARFGAWLVLVPSLASAQAVSVNDERPPEPPAPAPVVVTEVDPALIQAIVDARIAAQPKTSGWSSDGFFLQTPDGATKLQLGGYTQFDSRFFVDDARDPHTDQFGFRSIRPEIKGTLLDHYDFRLLPDFAGGKTTLQDAYVDIRYRNEVKLRFGKFKVPFGLERLQRDIYTTFVERGLPSLLTPNRDVGVQVFGELASGTIEYEAGVFDGVADNASSDSDTSDHKQGVARVFVHPIAGLGLGGGATFGWEQGTAATPLTPQYVTQGGTTFFQYANGAVASGRHWRASAQGSYYRGPLGVLAEYVRSAQHVGLAGTNDLTTFDAWQGVAQWVITGEPASYASVVPAHSFEPGKGLGAFDVTARYGELRVVDGVPYMVGLADPTQAARHTRSLGAGVDWFPNRAMRFIIDVEHTWYWLGAATGDRAPETSIIGRVQTAF